MAQGSEGAGLFLSMVERRRQARMRRFGAAVNARRNALEFRQELIQQRMRQLEQAQGLVRSLSEEDNDQEDDDRPKRSGRGRRSTTDSEDPRGS